MITAADLSSIDIFAGLGHTQQQQFARKAADIRLEAGETLLREGNIPGFFVLLEGEMKLEKDILGIRRQLGSYLPGDYFGELPILLGAPSLIDVRAETRCRVAKFDRQQLQELIRDSAQSSAAILRTMNERILLSQQHAKATPSARVVLQAGRYDRNCHTIRAFLAANRVQYEWTNPDNEPERLPTIKDGETSTVTIDGVRCIATPSVREVAEALGFQTRPKQANYDVVIIGAGPAGMAAGVYGASEGLAVLMVERSAAGGQAGTSSRIENYLGFPGGISGDELSERALKQASRFGAEIAMTRSVVSIQQEDNGYCLWMDGKESVSARAVLLASGVEWRRLHTPGLDGLLGRGVLYGASRTEAVGVGGKRVLLVGGGNSAGQAAMFFSDYAEEVRMLVRGPGLQATMSQYLINQIATKNNIVVESFTQVIAIEGEEKLERVITSTHVPNQADQVQTRDADALFIMIGANANTGWLPGNLERDSKGFIRTGRNLRTWHHNRQPFPLETNLPGLFCAGDVRHESIKRVASGVGEGSMAISFIHQYLAS